MNQDDDFDLSAIFGGIKFENDETAKAKISQEKLESVVQRFETLYRMVDGFLEKMKENPNSEMIRWPNRAQNIMDFQKQLSNIYHGVNKK